MRLEYGNRRSTADVNGDGVPFQGSSHWKSKSCFDQYLKNSLAYLNFKAIFEFFKWGTVAHWLKHWTHDHKVVGTSPDSSSLCWVPEQDS